MYTPPTTLALALALALALCTSTIEAAGPHEHRRIATHRRHHARAAAAVAASGGSANTVPPLSRRDESGSCTLGAWKCYGSELHRCYNDQWNFVTNCTGADIVCSDALYTTGCIWSWDVESVSNGTAATASDSASDSATSTSSAIASAHASGQARTSSTAALATASSSSVAYGNTVSIVATATVTATATSGVNATSALTEPTDDDDSEEDCDDGDEEGDTDTDDDDDDGDDDDAEECEADDDDASTSSTYAAASVVTATDTATATTTTSSSSDLSVTDSATSETASASNIGGELWAGSGDDDDETTSLSSSTTTRGGKTRSYGHHRSSSTAQGAAATQTTTSYDEDGNAITITATSSYGANSTVTATTTSSDDDWSGTSASLSAGWSDGTATVTAAGTATVTAAATATSTTTTNGTQNATSSAGTGKHHTSAGMSASAALPANSTIAASGRTDTSGLATATTSAPTYAATITSSSNTTSNTSSSTTSWTAPHWVIYADEWLTSMPSVSDLSAFNRFILAFWMSDSGAVDDAEAWEGFSASTRASVLEEYHDAGIALMVSAFGSTDAPTSDGKDAKQTAQDLAAWVKKYDLDGVDIDYEDMDAMNSAQAVSWLVEFQTELRSLLPSPYIISHAPVAPWFTSASDYSDGAYVSIDQQVGDGIDWYNVQFYNQGSDQYTTCDTLITDSGTDWPSTSVLELNSYAGLPLDKIVIGKPLDEGAADNGYMDAATIHQCIEVAQQSGWNAGVMFWEWTDDAPTIMATVRADFD